jgi:hypothetical protein
VEATPNGDLFKEVIGTESGLDLLEITRHDSLDFSIHFERVAGSGYWINITNEAVAGVGRRLAQFATLNSTNLKVFILREVKGPPEEPTELVLELKETVNASVFQRQTRLFAQRRTKSICDTPSRTGILRSSASGRRFVLAARNTKSSLSTRMRSYFWATTIRNIQSRWRGGRRQDRPAEVAQSEVDHVSNPKTNP